MTRISPLQAAEKLAAGWTYLDVRPADEFADGHPQGAVNIPFEGAPERFLAAVKSTFPDLGTKLVIGCRVGVVSIRATEALARAGYTELLEQRAGFHGARGTFGELTEAGWERAGLPVERSEEDG